MSGNQRNEGLQGYNVLIIYNEQADRLLMCRRSKEPYKGLSNLVGGKIEPGEDGLAAAYRELEEETALTAAQISLYHVMDMTYYYQNCYLEVYAGRLHDWAEVYGDENELYWADVQQNFFDMSVFAGEGNIGHMLEVVRMSGVLH